MVLVSKGNPRAAHTLSFLDFNGWEKKTLEFVLEPTVLKGRDLDPIARGETLNVIDAIDENVLTTSGSSTFSLRTAKYEKLWKKLNQLMVLADQANELESSEDSEEVKKLGEIKMEMSEFAEEVEAAAKRAKEMASRRTGERMAADATDAPCAAVLQCEKLEWREKAMECLMDWLLFETRALSACVFG